MLVRFRHYAVIFVGRGMLMEIVFPRDIKKRCNRLNVEWINNQGTPQAPKISQAQQQGKSSQLEEALAKFLKVTQTSFEHVRKTQVEMFKTQRKME